MHYIPDHIYSTRNPCSPQISRKFAVSFLSCPANRRTNATKTVLQSRRVMTDLRMVTTATVTLTVRIKKPANVIRTVQTVNVRAESEITAAGEL